MVCPPVSGSYELSWLAVANKPQRIMKALRATGHFGAKPGVP
jgi:hypothetical protein